MDLLKRTSKKHDMLASVDRRKEQTQNTASYCNKIASLFEGCTSSLTFLNRRIKVLIVIGIVCLLYIGICDVCGIEKFFKWGKRVMAIKVMHMFRLEEWRNSRCLVNNDLKKKAVAVDSDICEICETIEAAKVFKLDQEAVERDDPMKYVHNDIPVVVPRHVGYPHTTITIDTFTFNFLDKDELSIYEPCQFKSNIKSKVSDHRQLLTFINDKSVGPYYVFWENCANLALKAFRSFYTRPKYIGENVQLTDSNWAILCSGYNGKHFKKIELFSPLSMVMVQAGTLDVQLVPIDNCRELCVPIELRLRSGDSLIFSTGIFELWFNPSCPKSETIVIGVGGSAD